MPDVLWLWFFCSSNRHRVPTLAPPVAINLFHRVPWVYKPGTVIKGLNSLQRRVFSGSANERDGAFSTAPSSASCWPLLKRWISSMNKIARPECLARSITSRTSFTPAFTALERIEGSLHFIGNNIGDGCLPTPGSPHKIMDGTWPVCIVLRMIPSGPVKCFCPMRSSKRAGRIRSASGCADLAYQIAAKIKKALIENRFPTKWKRKWE